MKSQTKSSPGPEDGPEEGEIVSDDLEDISDESIIFTPNTGKSLSRSANLHGLSLSSVTDLDEPLLERRRKRRKSYGHTRRRKRSRKKILDSDSSDNETGVDRKLKLQLKAAVRVDVEEAHRNSLRTRLRSMVNGHGEPESEPEQAIVQSNNEIDSPLTIIDLVEQDTSSCMEIVASGSDKAASAPDTCGSAAENNDSASDQLKSEEIDSELIQLRLEALKTAINNKFANKKRRKKDDTNKENTSIKENQETKTLVSENVSPQTSNEAESNVPPSPDEDEDVLRALLLASMSNKITKIQPEPSKLSTQTKLTKANQNKIFLNQMKTNNFKLNNNMKRVLNNVKNGATKLIKVPQVKPLIINLNSDSDSDWELSSSPEKSPKKTQIANSNIEIMTAAQDLEAAIETSNIKCPDLNKTVVAKTDTIETTVEKFLKQQRAEVESKRTTIENVSEVDSGAATNTVSKPLVIIEKKKVTTPLVTPEQKKTQTLPELEKSALKFLPESKREEYKKLQNLLKLKKAQMKRPKPRRLSQKLNDNTNNLIKSVINNGNLKACQANTTMVVKNISAPKTINTLNKHINQTKTINVPAIAPKQNSTTFSVKRVVHSKATQTAITKQTPVQLSQKAEARLEEFRCQEVRAAMREREKRHESLVLRATLKQLQTKRDGRLQIQEKYKDLRPLVKKLNEVSKSQKHWDQEVERLVAELAKAREIQDGLHRDMLVSVKELAQEKKKIDVSLTKVISKPKPNHPVTSTPIKPAASSTSLTTNSLLTSSISMSPDKTLVQETDNSCSKNPMNTWEQSTIPNNQNELSVADPNDIDNIIKKTEERVAVLEKNDTFKCRKSEKLKYVSPLDALKRHDVLDPFGIMCPFEVNGTCKDPECAFNHLP